MVKISIKIEQNQQKQKKRATAMTKSKSESLINLSTEITKGSNINHISKILSLCEIHFLILCASSRNSYNIINRFT